MFLCTSYSSLKPMLSFTLRLWKWAENFAAEITLKYTQRRSRCSADDVRCLTRNRKGLTLAFYSTVWCHYWTTVSCCGKEQSIWAYLWRVCQPQRQNQPYDPGSPVIHEDSDANQDAKEKHSNHRACNDSWPKESHIKHQCSITLGVPVSPDIPCFECVKHNKL